jgi:hypothetical protein
MVDGVSFPGRQADEHVGFWMDTLCIPVPEKGMGEEERKKRKELRKFCIVNMRHIYESASAVLVLESSLQEISTSTPIADKCVAIYQTKWRRRLWTFQEGALTQQLYFQFTDKSQHAHDLMDRTLEKKDSLKAKGIYTALLPNTISAAIAAIRILSGVDEGSIDTNRWMLLLSVAGEFCSRQTSRTTDETLCASTVLGIDPSPFVEIEEDDEHDELMVADLRMELLFRRLGKIQSFIIFNTRPRLKKEGFRWAPRSWMGGAADDIGGSSGADEEYGDASIRQWGAGASDVGLQVVFRAIGLRSIPNGFDAGHRKFVVMDKKKSMRCSVQLVPDELGQYPVWETGSNYVLVLARELSAPDALGCVAVLGRLLLPLGQVRHECLAWVELQADSKTFDIAGEFTQQCMWIIV